MKTAPRLHVQILAPTEQRDCEAFGVHLSSGAFSFLAQGAFKIGAHNSVVRVVRGSWGKTQP
ncbi:MAG: hypothetical protein C5B50_20800, partial [Verrucomicrobia bacterium]